MLEQPSRRKFLGLTLGLIAAPAIVRASSLMPVKAYYETRQALSYLREISIFSDGFDRFTVWQVEERDLIGLTPDVIPMHVYAGLDKILVGKQFGFLTSNDARLKLNEIQSEFRLQLHLPGGPGSTMRYIPPSVDAPVSVKSVRVQV